MREIKFRGVDIANNRWIYGNLEIPLINQSKSKYFIIGYAYGQYQKLEVDPKTIGQYTGLKDKNGKEIYEGDIVTGQSFESSMLNHWKSGILKHLDYEVEHVPEMYVIKYHEASFKTFNLKGRWVAVLNHHVSSMVEDLQVVGNIYENPELLEGRVVGEN